MIKRFPYFKFKTQKDLKFLDSLLRITVINSQTIKQNSMWSLMFVEFTEISNIYPMCIPEQK